MPHRAEQRLLALVGCIRGLVLELDGDARYVNAWADDPALLARPTPELIGKTIDEVLGPAGAVFTAMVKRVYATGTMEHIEYALDVPGGRRWFLADVKRVGTEASAMTVVFLARDITDRRTAEEALARSDRLAALGTLAAGVGHEINNPLSYVIGNLECAIDALGDARGEQRELLEDALEGARRIAEIVKSLRMFTREGGDELSAVDVQAVLESALKMADNEIRFRARLTRHFGVVPRVRANAGQLAQVFLNLLINAAQAIGDGDPEHNEVVVTTSVGHDGRVAIAIGDTGCGIAAEHAPRIFDPFFTTKPVGAGSGLGLAISHRLVEKLGGEIAVTSQPGIGSTFTVYLAAAEQAPTRRPRVLVVDDEVQIGRSITRMLDKRADVVCVTRARDALARLTSGETFELVLCDLMMPEMTGIDLYGELRAIAPELLATICFMTGGAFTHRAHEFLTSSGVRCYEKPLDRASVLALLP